MKTAYVKTRINNIINVTDIVTIHYYEFDRSFEFAGESHDFWELVYVDSGEVEITRDGERLLLKQGEIVFHKPNEFHTIKAYNSSPNIFVISFVCKSSAMTYFERFKTVLDKNLKPFIASVLAEANDTYIIRKNDVSQKKLLIKNDAPFGGEQQIKTYLEQLLILLVRKMVEKKNITVFPSKESLETHLVIEIKAYIKERVRDNVAVNDICKTFGYSKTYLSYLFKEQTSTSIARYFTTCKIEEAKKLIRENAYNFSQISEMLSFDNPQYFTRVFKRIVGLTPSQFKNSLNRKNA